MKISREDAVELLDAAREELKTARFHIVGISIESAETFMDCVDIQSVLRDVNRELNLGLFSFFTWSFGLNDGNYIFLFTDYFSIY